MVSLDDPRYKNITWFNTHDVAANLTRDDDTTQLSYILQMEKPPYPIKRVFFNPKNVDLIYTFFTCETQAIPDWRHYVYAYEETQPIEIWAVTKQGITGDKSRWKGEAELRRIAETYPLGSVRHLTRLSPVERDRGTWKLHAVRYNMWYKRASYDYTSGVSLSYGNALIYDGNRLSGGTEGAWTLTQGGGSTCSQSVTAYHGFLYLHQTVFGADSYTSSGDNLGLVTNTYTKIRWRFRTTSNAKAKIILEFSDASTQTVLAETAASTFSVGTATITAAKTLDHIHLYCCDGTGDVYYDYVQIYKGDFTFPNVVNLIFTPSSRNLNLDIPMRVPSETQNLGADPASIELMCDIDLQQYNVTDNPTGVKWTRTGDVEAGDVFLDVAHNQSVLGPWQYLAWGDKGCRVTLDEPQFNYGRDGMLRLLFHEFSDTNKANEYYYQRWDEDT